jgi:hypothetical protein
MNPELMLETSQHNSTTDKQRVIRRSAHICIKLRKLPIIEAAAKLLVKVAYHGISEWSSQNDRDDKRTAKRESP